MYGCLVEVVEVGEVGEVGEVASLRAGMVFRVNVPFGDLFSSAQTNRKNG